MNPASRLALELGQLRRVLPAEHFRRYCLALAVRTPGIIAARTLVPADKAMTGTVLFRLAGEEIRLALDETERLLAGHDSTPTFGGAREMYASNVYLRGFRSGLKAEAVLDLGSNRGLFLLQAAKVLGARTLVGVEPQACYTPVFAALAAANGIPGGSCTRYESLVAARPAEGAVTLAEIIASHRLARFGFVKCDIEGGEFEVLMAPDAPLDRIDNLAMELHPDKGDVTALAAWLERAGFEVVVTDQFDAPVAPARGHYLYASRSGDLVRRQSPAGRAA